jgi:membrane-bound lytic murein transglycosylase B
MSNPTQETTPDQLLESFRGRSFKSVILFTVIVHVVIVCGTSIPYLMKTITGKSASKLNEKDRIELAAREATEALRDIATKHGIKPQDLSSRIAGGAAPKAPVEKEEEPAPKEEPVTPETPPTVEPEKPKSEIEKELEVKQEGPKVPEIKVEEATEEDLFSK